MSNYKIIVNEEVINNFVDQLPDLLPNEQYYIALFARRKYNKNCNLTADKSQLKRVTATKDRIVEKIRQMECAIGSYTFNGEPIKQDNLAIYISPNPRDLTKSGLKMLKEIADKVSKNEIYNPHTLAMNCIQQSGSRKIYFDIDIDFIDNSEQTLKEVIQTFHRFFDRNLLFASPIIRTNGGIHVLIKLDHKEIDRNNKWYDTISRFSNSIYTVTMSGTNSLVPIPGCIQGKDFSPYICNLN